jgi:hypothetical protein
MLTLLYCFGLVERQKIMPARACDRDYHNQEAEREKERVSRDKINPSKSHPQ